MNVESIMTKDPVAVDVQTGLAEAARQMRDKGVGCVVILRGGKVAGLCTDRQIVTHGVAEDMPLDTPIEDIMVESPACLRPDDSIVAAVDTLRSAGVVRRAPVVNELDELIGIVSISDIAVLTDRLLKGIMLEETHHALDETRLLTGGKRITKLLRRPSKVSRLPPDEATHVTREPTPPGLPTKKGKVRIKRR